MDTSPLETGPRSIPHANPDDKPEPSKALGPGQVHANQAQHGGGQSLIPMMLFSMLRVPVDVDLTASDAATVKV